MAGSVGGERDMQHFVRSLFQGSPDLSILTHAIVRKKYLDHVGQETLTKEEKEQLKRLVEEELVQMQVEDSASRRELVIESQASVRPGGQKRRLCLSDTSGDEVRTRQEQKKQRTGKELEVSSDEQDSGIDSKKIPVHSSPRSAGKLSGAPDQGDSGAEDHSEGSGSDRQSTKKKSRGAGGRKVTQEHQSGRQRSSSASESEETNEGQGSDLEEEIGGCKKTREGQSSESDEEQALKDCKLQKKRPFSKQQKWAGRLDRGKTSKMLEGKRRTDSESEEENEPLQVGKAKEVADRSEDGKGAGGSQKAGIRARQRTQKVQEESDSWGGSEDDAEEEKRMRKKVPNNEHGRKSEESESDSDNTEDSPMRKETPRTKTRRAGEEKRGHRLARESEVREKSERQMGKRGMAQRKELSRRELEEEQGDCVQRCRPKKRQGGLKSKRSGSSSDELEKEMAESQGLRYKKEVIGKSSNEGDESLSEEEEGGSKAPQAPGSSNESESKSENDIGDRRKEKMVTKRRKGVSGSEDEKTKGRRTAKSQKESGSEMESEGDSEDSGRELEGKKKRGGQQKKATPKPKRRSNSKEAPENESVEETGGSSSEDKPHYSKQRHRGKDREHSEKREDHPSIQRLKRYIRECGVHRNYKKLLAGCRSRRAQVEALKKELENIGLKGVPSLVKCRALKRQREEAAEVASLDLSNIIATEGRPRRRNVWSLYSKPQEAPSSPEEESIRRPATDWSRLRGVISSDGESN
ncbi:hypothetical protein lerEdw1_009281 [Lerista edwardsae]|nr:hypothetical protein lerEdw1_009281 [Lerista edwardsae]